MAHASLSTWIKRLMARFQVNQGASCRRARRRPNRALLLELLEQRDCPSTLGVSSPDNATFLVGSSAPFTVTTNGAASTPSLSDGGATLPTGVTFHDNGDGTATLAGTPAAGSGNVYAFTISATDVTDGTVTQSFTLEVDEAASITSPAAAGFSVGTTGTFNVTTGHEFPTASLVETGTLPAGVTFFDNNDGTATLIGMPNVGTEGSYPLTITAHNGIGADAVEHFTLTVLKQSLTTLTATPSTPSFGLPVTLKATVAPAIGSTTLTGTVTFFDNGIQLGSPKSMSGGKATFTTTALSAGSHAFTAVYNGNTAYGPSTSAEVDKSLAATGTKVLLTPSTLAPVYGQPITFTAHVNSQTPGTGKPTGTVEIFDGAFSLGTAPVTNGVASPIASLFSVGTHSMTAVFTSDDSNFADATSAAVNEKVTAARAKVDLTASSPATAGEDVTLTATVTIRSPGAADPSGTVTFTSGLTTVGTAPVIDNVATLVTNTLPAGTHTFMASYGGDLTTASSSNTARLLINRAPTAVDMTGSPLTSLAGQTVTLTAVVTNTDLLSVEVPTGVVAFYHGAALLGTGTVDIDGRATFTTQKLAFNSNWVVTAAYRGDLNCAPSSTPWTIDVERTGQDVSTVLLTSDGNPSTAGNKVAFTATIIGLSGTPTGTVTFNDGTKLLGTATVQADGTATLSNVNLNSGTHSITGTYNGDINYSVETSAAFTQVVAVGTTSTLSASTLAPVFGQPVTFTVHVNSTVISSTKPTGTVVLLDGGTPIDGATVTNGVATLTGLGGLGELLDVGTHSLTALFTSDNSLYADSTSAVFHETIGQARTTTAFSASLSPAIVGQSVDLTATVSVLSPGAAIPSGNVTFKDGTTVLGVVAVSALTGTATFTTSTLTAGTHTFTLSYGGDTDTATSSTIGRLTVNQVTTTTTLNALPTFGLADNAITLTANVVVTGLGLATPSGVVAFYQGAALLGTGTVSGGVATYTTQNLAKGSYTFSAIYRGDSSCLTSTASSVSIQMVAPPVISSVTAASANGTDPSGTISLANGTTVNATVVASDPQSFTITYTYVWLIDGTIVAIHSSAPTTDSLDLSLYGASDGDTVTVVVTPNNGVWNGFDVTSNTLDVTDVLV